MKKHGHSISFVVSSKPHYQAEFQYLENNLLALSLFLEISVPFVPVSKFVKKKFILNILKRTRLNLFPSDSNDHDFSTSFGNYYR